MCRYLNELHINTPNFLFPQQKLQKKETSIRHRTMPITTVYLFRFFPQPTISFFRTEKWLYCFAHKSSVDWVFFIWLNIDLDNSKLNDTIDGRQKNGGKRRDSMSWEFICCVVYRWWDERVNPLHAMFPVCVSTVWHPKTSSNQQKKEGEKHTTHKTRQGFAHRNGIASVESSISIEQHWNIVQRFHPWRDTLWDEWVGQMDFVRWHNDETIRYSIRWLSVAESIVVRFPFWGYVTIEVMCVFLFRSSLYFIDILHQQAIGVVPVRWNVQRMVYISWVISFWGGGGRRI